MGERRVPIRSESERLPAFGSCSCCCRRFRVSRISLASLALKPETGAPGNRNARNARTLQPTPARDSASRFSRGSPSGLSHPAKLQQLPGLHMVGAGMLCYAFKKGFEFLDNASRPAQNFKMRIKEPLSESPRNWHVLQIRLPMTWQPRKLSETPAKVPRRGRHPRQSQ